MSIAAPRFRDVINRQHFPALDGIRACAVLAVIFGHHNYPIPAVPADLGVAAFFVLSGFLITRLLMREQDAAGDVSLKRFYARRTLRIFPAYYAFLALSFAADWIQGARWDRWLGVSALTYTVNYYNAFNQHPSNSISHAWSLGVEEQFYLLWPLLFVLLARRSRNALMLGVGVLASLAIVRRSLLLAQGASVSYLYNAFDTRFDNLAVGCLIALAADTRTIEAVAETLAQRVWYPLVTLAALLVSRNLSTTYHYTAGFTVNALLLAILIVQLLQLHRSRLWSWLEHPVTRYLGAISYPMYLYHQWGDSVGRHTVSGKHPVFWVGLLATVGLATGSYYVLERPFLKLRRYFEVATLKPAPAEAGGVRAGGDAIGVSSKKPAESPAAT